MAMTDNIVYFGIELIYLYLVNRVVSQFEIGGCAGKSRFLIEPSQK